MAEPDGRRAVDRFRAQVSLACVTTDDVPMVGPREQCPCGSGRRYKACHGKQAARNANLIVTDPFAGIASECDLVALAVLVPAATANLPMVDGQSALRLATVLPMAWPALHRADGEVVVGMQFQGSSGDISRDLAAAWEAATELPPGTPVLTAGRPGPGRRLQDVVDTSAPIEVDVTTGFDFWLDGVPDEVADQVRAGIEHANEQVVPTKRLSSVEAAYWCRIGTKEHLRWVLPEPEEQLLDAFARLADQEKLHLGAGTKYVGSFRSHGKLIAVWDLAPGDEADDVEAAAQEFRGNLDAALTDGSALTSELRRIRSGLTSRQVTVR